MVAWFFQRKLNRNANQLKTLRAEKKRLIEQVMDKETYKVALEILNRFGDTSARIQHQQMSGGMRSILFMVIIAYTIILLLQIIINNIYSSSITNHITKSKFVRNTTKIYRKINW